MKKASTDKCIALLFWADWHPPCHQLKDQIIELAKIYKEIKFTWVSHTEMTINRLVVQQ